MTILIHFLMLLGWLGSGFCSLLFLSIRFRWFDRRLPDSALGTLACLFVWPAVVLIVPLVEVLSRDRHRQA
jgi:hypothetical protein